MSTPDNTTKMIRALRLPEVDSNMKAAGSLLERLRAALPQDTELYTELATVVGTHMRSTNDDIQQDHDRRNKEQAIMESTAHNVDDLGNDSSEVYAALLKVAPSSDLVCRYLLQIKSDKGKTDDEDATEAMKLIPMKDVTLDGSDVRASVARLITMKSNCEMQGLGQISHAIRMWVNIRDSLAEVVTEGLRNHKDHDVVYANRVNIATQQMYKITMSIDHVAHMYQMIRATAITDMREAQEIEGGVKAVLLREMLTEVGNELIAKSVDTIRFIVRQGILDELQKSTDISRRVKPRLTRLIDKVVGATRDDATDEVVLQSNKDWKAIVDDEEGVLASAIATVAAKAVVPQSPQPEQ